MLPMPPAYVAETPAQALLAFDLKGALARAKEQNALLKAASARVDERRGLITATRADALPQFNAVADFTRNRDVTIINSSFGDLFNIDKTKITSLIAPRSLYTTLVSVSQPIFYFGKLDSAMEVAKVGELEAQAAYTTTELDTLHGVAKVYLAVLGAEAQLEVVAVRMKTSERFLEDVRSKLDAQSATQLDLLRAQAELQGVIPDMLQAKADFARALEVLDGQLGLDPSTPLKLERLSAPEIPKDLQGVSRSELQQLEQQEKAIGINDRILSSDMKPKLDLNANYGWQAGSTDNLFREPYESWRLSLTLKVPIFDGLRSSGKRAQNRAVLEQVKQQKVDLERQIQVQQQTARREIQKAIALLEAATKAHDAGKEALRVSRESFDQGLITSLDLLQAERTERQMESARVRAELGVWSALFDERRSLGLPPL